MAHRFSVLICRPMGIKMFEQIIAWKKSRLLTLAIYKQFRNCKDYGFRDQIQRASVSVMNNIAEGFERGGNKEFIQFLYIAKSSCGEVRSMLYLSVDLRYVSKKDFGQLYKTSVEISKLLSGLIKKL